MSQVKERPILFSAPMVRAILEGRKTVTRRVCKPQPSANAHTTCASGNPMGAWWETGKDINRCPHGQPGDRLWVREAWAEINVAQAPGESWVVYRECDNRTDYGGPWKPSIHMRRRDSRILLEITEVRVERLQDIREDQAKAEGCFFTDYGQQCFHGATGWKDVGDCPAKVGHQQRNGWAWDKTTSHEQCLFTPRFAFANLWNATGGDWDANPWCWAVSFKRVTP